MNFRQLDLNLLRVLAAIYRTNSVTAASKALSLSQPATSNALARLRVMLGDELFVRTPTGLITTQACQRIGPAVVAQLQALEQLMAGDDAFDLATCATHWRLSMSDLGEMMFLPPLAAALRKQAPHAFLSNVSVGADDVPRALESREIDCAIGILRPKRRGIRTAPLFQERYVAITSQDWRPPGRGAGSTLTIAQLATSALVVSSPTATFHSSVEEMLVRKKLADCIKLRVRHFGALAELTMTTDLVAIVPDVFARLVKQRHDVRIWTLVDAPVYDVRLVWHASTEKDPYHAWMRSLIHDLFAKSATA